MEPGRYRARDLLRAPGLLSLSRVPLAASFPLLVHRTWAAMAVCVAAGVTDMLDGWVARRSGQVSATGSALDPICDKIFVLTVAITLVANERLSLAELAGLSTREIGELPLFVWFWLSPRARRVTPQANLAGKLTTVLQGGAVTWAILGVPGTRLWVLAAAAAGVVAAASYWKRALARPSGAKARPLDAHG
jgi:CDP-diacylglycerol--glycerol-3-phosphate 3-phosphatidyltransferase/cardiolipin synthase